MRGARASQSQRLVEGPEEHGRGQQVPAAGRMNHQGDEDAGRQGVGVEEELVGAATRGQRGNDHVGQQQPC